MLIIRNEQLSIFEDARRRSFGDDTLAFIRTNYPDACSRFSEAELRGLVAIALRKAKEHRFTDHADILRYINVMYTLGCEFEADPDFPWAREIMGDTRLRPGSKMDRLSARTLDHLRALEQDR